MHYVIEREDKGPLIFNGEEIAHVSTYCAGKERWTELYLYVVSPTRRDVTVRWVVESYGKTLVRGEKEFHTVVTCSSIAELIAAVSSKEGSVSGPGIDLLDEAGERDAEIDQYLESVFKVEERL